MVLVTVTKAEDPQEYELELCRNRGADWRHNQHNYIFSGFLKKVCCRIRTDGNYSIIKLHCKLQQKERRLDWKSARRYCRERCMDLVSIGRQHKKKKTQIVVNRGMDWALAQILIRTESCIQGD